ncbi:hypothetical protein KG089_04990 [Carnobacteriaceae bacterium zg-ZUI252]|nr:hypothetical protein [Carnobacteriaceae bacterium zg-ZUI252]MBS4770169.1 hypothetical protein [Carnobacteriaceae bacterium zg-ZUI240]QTU82763.1 hypothetical protein J7S27_05695 [Carnobacteriaceae bacterium zg-C25]
MSAKRTLKKINALFTQLSWLYLIIISLFVLLIIQVYIGTIQPNNRINSQQKQQLSQLEMSLQQQQQTIESMQKEIDALKKR